MESVENKEFIFAQCKEVLRSKLDLQIFKAWIEPLDFKNSSAETEIKIVAPSKFFADHVRHKYEPLLKDVFKDCLKITEPKVCYGVADGPVARKSAPIRVVKEQPQSQPQDLNLNEKYNFSNFVVGSCNQFAHAVALQVSQSPGKTYNPLFLYGGVGLGKTHLVNAIGNASKRQGKKVLLVSSELFVNELIASIRGGDMHKFKTKFRSLDLLIIDDVQFLIGKERTQEEFFHTFNDLHQNRKQIVITSDRVPQELVGLEERLRTRFSSGLTADIQAPDLETRMAILSKKAEANGIDLSGDVVTFLAEKIDTNVRELEGALNRLQALSSITSSEIDLPLAHEAMKAFLPNYSREITPEFIQKFVARRYGVGVNDLTGKRRTQNVALSRHIAMYTCRLLTGASFPEIGALFGGRDHSTVIHAQKSLEERMHASKSFKKEIEILIKDIQEELK